MSHNHEQHQDHERLERIERELKHLARGQREILYLLSHPAVKGITKAIAQTGDISMPQTTYTNVAGSDVITLSTIDNSNQDITSRCTYSASSDAAAVSVGSFSANTFPLTNAANPDGTPGLANLTIKTVDPNGEVIPDLVWACTISAGIKPPPGTGATTATAQTGTIS